MNDQIKSVEEYLENVYIEARMFDDLEMMVKIRRALVAFRADVSEDIFKNGFEEDMIEKMAEKSARRAKEKFGG